jgi:hypothetical protein
MTDLSPAPPAGLFLAIPRAAFNRLAAQSRQREEHMKKRKKSGSLSKAKKSAKSALRKTGSKLKRVAKKAAAATGMA